MILKWWTRNEADEIDWLTVAIWMGWVNIFNKIYFCGWSDSFMIMKINHILYSSACWLIVTKYPQNFFLLPFQLVWLPHEIKKKFSFDWNSFGLKEVINFKIYFQLNSFLVVFFKKFFFMCCCCCCCLIWIFNDLYEWEQQEQVYWRKHIKRMMQIDLNRYE